MLRDYLQVLPQYLLPQHTLSRLIYGVSRLRWRWWKNALIRWFTRHYGVDLSLAARPDLAAYPDFNSFFTRPLRPGARSVAHEADAIACPVDGTVSQAGDIRGNTLFQAKGRSYSLITLLGGDRERAAPLRDGSFATLYLGPRDYHRVHMPVRGRLREMVYVPGRLFSVNTATAQVVPGLFARNERVVTLFETPAGPMALVLVGAIGVGSIETVWSGRVTPPYLARIGLRSYGGETDPILLERGEEMGRFNLGSTVLLLFGAGQVRWIPELKPGCVVQMGRPIARRLTLR
jgi:phosphatidylserine decarboxylase